MMTPTYLPRFYKFKDKKFSSFKKFPDRVEGSYLHGTLRIIFIELHLQWVLSLQLVGPKRSSYQTFASTSAMLTATRAPRCLPVRVLCEKVMLELNAKESALSLRYCFTFSWIMRTT